MGPPTGTIAHGHDDAPVCAAKCSVRQHRGFRLRRVTETLIRVVIGRSQSCICKRVIAKCQLVIRRAVVVLETGWAFHVGLPEKSVFQSS